MTLDKAYGEIVFTSNAWGTNENGTFFWKWTDLETYPCSTEELGIDRTEGKKSRFMPFHYSSKKTVEFKQKTFLCMRKEESYVYGDYNTNQGRTIRIKLRKCVGHSYCKTDEEIN